VGKRTQQNPAVHPWQNNSTWKITFKINVFVEPVAGRTELAFALLKGVSRLQPHQEEAGFCPQFRGGQAGLEARLGWSVKTVNHHEKI
jgi:hypothetical protein